jgi:hypothetical protein
LERLERRTKSPQGICWDSLLARSPAELVPDALGEKWLKLFKPADAADPIERRIVEALEQSANEPAPPGNRLEYEPSANGVGGSHE